MLYECVASFDVTKNLKFFGFWGELNKAWVTTPTIDSSPVNGQRIGHRYMNWIAKSWSSFRKRKAHVWGLIIKIKWNLGLLG
jgi:hypothetical protein